MDYSSPGSSVHEDSPGKNTAVGCYALLQGIFPTMNQLLSRLPISSSTLLLVRSCTGKSGVLTQDPFYLSGCKPKLSPIAPGKCQELCSTSQSFSGHGLLSLSAVAFEPIINMRVKVAPNVWLSSWGFSSFKNPCPLGYCFDSSPKSSTYVFTNFMGVCSSSYICTTNFPKT